MDRIIKFRAWDEKTHTMYYSDLDKTVWAGGCGSTVMLAGLSSVAITLPVMQFTGIKDRNKVEIYEGDVLEFADKWEWYRGSYGIKMRFAEPERKAELQKQYDAEPMERRVIEMPDCYEWILSSEIQTYWHVIGNIHQNPELITA